MTYVHPNLSEHDDHAVDLAELTHRLNDAGDHIELAAAIYDAASLPPVAMRRVMRALARRQGAAPVTEAYELAARRLRALLQLDVEVARIAARGFADAHIDLPDGWSDRNREIEFDVIKNALHVREFAALAGILPWLRDHEAAEWVLQRLPDAADGETTLEIGQEEAALINA